MAELQRYRFVFAGTLFSGSLAMVLALLMPKSDAAAWLVCNLRRVRSACGGLPNGDYQGRAFYRQACDNLATRAPKPGDVALHRG